MRNLMERTLHVLSYCKLSLLLCYSLFPACIASVALYVGLAKPVQYVREPLSNHPIDLTSVKLKVVVNEDARINTTICYRTLNGTAKSGIHYQYSEGKLFIPANADFIELKVNIFSERSSTINKWFTVYLYPCYHDDNIILAPYNTTRVVIKDFHVGGAFFPTQPVIKTLTGDDIIEKGGHLVTSYTKPLICVTVSEFQSHYIIYYTNGICKWRQRSFRPLSRMYMYTGIDTQHVDKCLSAWCDCG